jgi:glycosyltransferase involved in cell wall biosynthesis
MKILQVVADGQPGGGTTCVLQLVEDLKQRGHEVHFASQQQSYALQSAAKAGAHVHDDIDFFRSRNDRQPPRQLAQLVETVQPQVVHWHGGRAAHFGARSGVHQRHWLRTVYTVHGYHFPRKRWPIRWAAAMAEHRSNRAAGSVVFVSKYDQQLARRWHLIPKQVSSHLVYNGVSAMELPSQSTPEPKRVIAVGRLTFQKDPHRVLDIAAQLASDGFQFDLVGGGEMEEEIRQRVESQSLTNVTIHGAISRQKTLYLLARASAFLLASRWEGLPIAPLEAMQARVPVVISDVGGNPELIEDGRSGFIVAQADTVTYAQRLRWLDDHPIDAQRMAQAAHERIDQHFSRQRMTAQYESLYRALIGQPSRA